MISKVEALELTVKLWRWLAAHPDQDKDDYFVWECIEDRPTEMCYLCQYAVEHFPLKGERFDCKEGCPIYDFFCADAMLNGWQPDIKSTPCENGLAAYALWDTANDSVKHFDGDLDEDEQQVLYDSYLEEVSFQASRLADAAEEALKNLN